MMMFVLGTGVQASPGRSVANSLSTPGVTAVNDDLSAIEAAKADAMNQVTALQQSLEVVSDQMETQALTVWSELDDAYSDSEAELTFATNADCREHFKAHFAETEASIISAISQMANHIENDAFVSAEAVQQAAAGYVAAIYSDINNYIAAYQAYVPADLKTKVANKQKSLAEMLKGRAGNELGTRAGSVADAPTLWAQVTTFETRLNAIIADVDAATTYTNFITIKSSLNTIEGEINTFVTICQNYQTIEVDDNDNTDPFISIGYNTGDYGLVRIYRTMQAAPVWNTICVPFNVTEAQMKATFGEDVVLADFTGLDDSGNFHFNSVKSMQANHPYLIKVPTDLDELRFPEVTLDLTYSPNEPGFEAPTPYGDKKIRFNGSYWTIVFGDNLIFLSYYQGKNKLFYSNSAARTMMKGFRGYFKYNSGDRLPNGNINGARLVFDFEGAKPSGISNVNANVSLNGNYYDLQGRRVENPAKGLYIVNGKKVYIK